MNDYYDGPDDAMVDAANIGQSLMVWIATNAPDAVWDTSPVDVVNDLAAKLYDAEQRATGAEAAASDLRARVAEFEREAEAGRALADACNLAVIYLEDGAPRTALDRLQKAGIAYGAATAQATTAATAGEGVQGG